jgi:tRNA-splicing endonuclease subunit Sen54
VTVARGVHFTSMGHSVQRPSPSSSSRAGKPRKRLELLPEEALYLMEKGALFCWKVTSRDDDVDDHDDGPGEDEDEGVEWDSASQGAPMSVQQAYAEMIGRQDLTLERYQVCEPSSPFASSLAQKPSCYGPSLPPSKKKDFLLPSPPGLHSDSSEASFPCLSRSCLVPSSAAAVHSVVVGFPPSTRRVLLADT